MALTLKTLSLLSWFTLQHLTCGETADLIRLKPWRN